MESGSDNSAQQETDKVTNDNEEPAATRKRTLWWNDENQTRLKKYIERMRNTLIDIVCVEGDLELGYDTVTQTTVANFLKIIDRNPVTYENYSPMRY